MNWLQVFLLSKIVYKKNSESLEYSAPPDLSAFNLNNLIVRTNPDTERLEKQIFSYWWEIRVNIQYIITNVFYVMDHVASS